MSSIQQMLIGSGSNFVFNQTISANTQNYNLKSAAIAAGWNQVDPLIATVTVNSGVYVGSSSSGSFAFDTGSTFPAGSQLAVVNNGYILGAGGPSATAGGPALRAQYALTVTNNGTVGGGGGGGAVGSQSCWSGGTNLHQLGDNTCIIDAGCGTYCAPGGAGGLGAGNYTTVPASGSASSGATYAWDNGGGCSVIHNPCVATYGTRYGGAGYTGGTLGSQGGGGGGAAGACTSGNANITWVATGTRYGTLN